MTRSYKPRKKMSDAELREFFSVKPTVVEDQFFDSEAPAPDAEPESIEPHAVLTRMSDVEPKILEWTWPGVIPKGKPVLFTGDPGVGKSTVLADTTARVSRGWAWPNSDIPTEQGAVLIFAAEDDIADTIHPRLMAAGADMSMVYVLEGINRLDINTGKFTTWTFQLDRDLPILASKVKELKESGVQVRLITIDPISCYMGKADSHNNAEVRGALAPLATFAAQEGISILTVSHLNKSGGGKAVYRTSGSLAFAAFARSVYVLVKDNDDPQRRLMLPVKCNLVKEPQGLAYSIDDGRVRWEEQGISITADEHMAREGERRDPEDSSELYRAVDWLRDQLRGGKKPSKILESDARENDISVATLRRAKNQLECIVRKDSDLKWYWSLPN